MPLTPDDAILSYQLAHMSEHKEISLLLPWYINGTLGATDRQRVDSHVAGCAVCQDDLKLEQRIHAYMATDVVVEHIPAASLKRLHSRLDAMEPDATPERRIPRRARRWSLPRLAAIAASVVACVAAAGIYAVHDKRGLGDPSAPAYYTVTDAEVRPSTEVIRAVFVPAVTLGELQKLLDEAQLRIVSGPTEAGVYSLAARSSRPVSLSLALLRQHPAVRFAEITRETPGKAKADDAP